MRLCPALIIISLCLALVWCCPAHAGARELVVGVENQNYRPYYWTEDGQYHSPARDILDAFARQQGLRLTYAPLPINRLYKRFLDGGLDFKFPDAPEWKSELKQGKTIAYSDPVLPFVDGVMVRPERKGQGPGQLKVLGTMLGFTPWAYLDQAKAGKVRLTENASLGGLLEQVIMGRVDGAYVNPVVANHHMRAVLGKAGELVFDPGLPHLESAYMLSSLKHPEVVEAFNLFMKTHKEMVAKVKKRYKLSLQ